MPRRLLLHAHSLQVTHPTRFEPVTFLAPPPACFTDDACALGVPRDALERLHDEAGVRWGAAPAASVPEEDVEPSARSR